MPTETTGTSIQFLPAEQGLSQVITIRKVANGFTVIVGCQTFVGLNWADVSEGLGLYFKDEKAAMEKYLPTEKKV